MNKLKEMYARAQEGAINSDEPNSIEKITESSPQEESVNVENEVREVQSTLETVGGVESEQPTLSLTEGMVESIINKFLFLKKTEVHLTSIQNFFNMKGSVEATILRSMQEENESLTSLKTLFNLKELEPVDRVFAMMDLSDKDLESLATQLENFTEIKKPILDIQGKTQYLKDLEKMISSIEEDKLGQLKVVGSFLVL